MAFEKNVVVEAIVNCETCGRLLNVRQKITHDEVIQSYGNIIGVALERCEESVRQAMKKRNWTETKCGKCIDQDEHKNL